VSINITVGTSQYKVDKLFWDRDSIFVDFDAYWSRLAALIAQKIAENTTTYWGEFNLVRTQAIKILGINPENGEAEEATPLKAIPVCVLHSILANGLRSSIKDKTLGELNVLFKQLIEKSLNECKQYLKDAVISKNLMIIKEINKKTKQILITNDKCTNNEHFIVEVGIKNDLFETLCEFNKEQLEKILINNTVFITSNIYLRDFYSNMECKNIVFIENIEDIEFSKSSGLESEHILINIDGASKGNPGPAAVGIVFYKYSGKDWKNGQKESVEEVSEFIGNETNNIAEYTALIRALEITVERGYKDVIICSDSELVVNQINGKYKVKDANIKTLFDKAFLLVQKIPVFKIIHIPREENSKADKLANNAFKVV